MSSLISAVLVAINTVNVSCLWPSKCAVNVPISTKCSASGAAPSGSPLAEDEDEDDPDLLDNDVPDLRSFTIETMKQ